MELSHLKPFERTHTTVHKVEKYTEAVLLAHSDPMDYEDTYETLGWFSL